MSRSIWNGFLQFGMVAMPVKIFCATESKDISFNQLHKECNHKINQIKICRHCDKQDLSTADIVKGYEYSKNNFIVLEENDLEHLPVPSKKSIAVTSFIDSKDIDPVHYEKTYYLEPDKAGEKPFTLFSRCMEEKDKIALAKFTLRTKERLCCIRNSNGNILLTTLFYPDEVRISPSKPYAAVPISEQELNMANMLIDMMSKPFNQEEVKDSYRESLLSLIDKKVRGVEVIMSDTPETKTSPDLFAALAATMESIKAKKT